MDKVLIKDLMKDTFRRSTLLAIPNLKDLLALNDNFTPQEVFFGIVKDALQTFEKYEPQYMMTKVYIDLDENRMFKFESNFDAYLKGILPEDSVCLIPTAIMGISTTRYTDAGSLYRTFHYDPPMLSEFWYGSKTYFMCYLANRPIVEDYDSVTKDYTDKCAIYYMTKDLGSKYKIFRDQVYLELCRYILNLKKNMDLQNLPVDLYRGLEEDMQNVQRDVENFYMNSATSGQYIK